MGQLTETEIGPRLPTISRKMAQAFGLTHYFTGTPCKRGHFAERFTSDACCGVCKEISNGKYIASHRDEIRERDRQAYAAGPEKFRARTKARWASGAGKQTTKEWLSNNPGYARDWYAKNAEDQRAKSRARWAARPDIYTAHGRNRRARKKAADGFHTAEDIAEIRLMQNDRCGYCRVKLRGKGHADHIKPLALGGSNWPRNIQLLCASCNHAKNASDPVDYARKTGRLV